MRLTSETWVSAYLRRCAVAGGYAALSRRGDGSAGAIFLEVIHADGVDLFAPALQMDAEGASRRFEKVLVAATPLDVTERLEKEKRFDSDLWVVTVEDPAGRPFLEDDEVV